MRKDIKKVPAAALYFRFIDMMNATAKAAGGVLLCFISAVVFASVVSRFIPGFSLTWVEELVTYALAWLCTLGGGIAARHGDMTAVTLGVSMMPPKAQKVMKVTSCGISLVIFVLIFRCGYQMAMIGAMRKSTAVPAVTMFWLYIALPAGMVIMFLNTAARMIEIIGEADGKGEDDK